MTWPPGPPPGPPVYPVYGYPAVAPPPRPGFPHDRPRPYQQMLRTWTYAPWRSTVGIVVLLVGFIVAVPVLALPVLFVAVAFQSGDYWQNVSDAASMETITPAAMLYLNATLGGMILLAWLIIRVLHGMRPRWLASVTPRLRWEFLFACLGLSVIALVLSLVVGAVLPSTGDDVDLSGGLNHLSASSAMIALIVLLTTPFQAAGEEYVFRGYLLMAVGSFVEKPWGRWFAILLTAFIFACAHLQFDPPVFFDRFGFGVVAAWLAIRTGGLEAGIALHILNNYLAFGFALAFGDITESLSDPQASWWNILVTLTQSISYALLVAWVAKKMSIQQLTRPPVPAAPTP
ncbi:MAG: CPBP family intramembrane metalloprotease [Nocardioidaceae bacterium]